MSDNWGNDPHVDDSWGNDPIVDDDVRGDLERKIAGMRGGAAEAFVHGGVNQIPFGQKVVGGISAGVIKLLKAYDPEKYRYLDDSASGNVDFERARDAKGAAEHGVAHFAGGLTGGAAAMAATSPFQVADKASKLAKIGAAAQNAGLYGMLSGAGHSDSLGDLAGKMGVEGAVNAAGGALGEGLGQGLAKLKDLAKRAAGTLKFHSLQPNPVVAEAAARIPGGESGVGQKLLEENIGGLTKKGTANQAREAVQEAGQAIAPAAEALDAAGIEAPGVQGIAQRAREDVAAPLMERPISKSTGQQVDTLMKDYGDLYWGKKPSFKEALRVRREIGDEAYAQGAGNKFVRNPRTTDYEAALQDVYHLANKEIESKATAGSPELAQDFLDKNLSYRQLGTAAQAAERTAARQTKNHWGPALRDLALGSAVGGGAAASGHYKEAGPLGTAVTLTSFLTNKYGSQAAARLMWEMANGSNRELVSKLAPYLAKGAIPEASNAIVDALRGDNK